MSKMPLVDVHAHLDDPQFSNDLDDVIGRATASGVIAIISNGTNPESNRRVLALRDKYPCVKAALGVYPNDAVTLGLHAVHQEISFIKEHAREIVAIGEVGIDRHHDENAESQRIMREAFILFARLSREIGKPLIVHSRKAEEETIEILEKESAKNVVFHCFGGNKKLAARIIKNGWYLSIPANLRRSSQFQAFVCEFPLQQLLTETDSPLLAPEGRNTRNEPANVRLTVENIAEIKGLTIEEAAKEIHRNYQRLFLAESP